MIFDAVKRFFGISGSDSSRNDNHLDVSIKFNDRLVPHSQIPPEINEIGSDFAQMGSDIAQVHKFMEEQMRSMMGSFGFIFGGPFSEIGVEGHPQFPFSPGIQDIPYNDGSSQVSKSGPPALDPRDEMLKPQFRSRSTEQWSGQDHILDERLSNEGLGSVIQDLKPSNELYERNNPVFGGFPSLFGNGGIFGPDSFSNGLMGNILDSTTSSSTVTIYSNVNGHKSMEKIVRRPDGTVERTVITGDDKPSLPDL
ncbi:uncharacterized protein LOC117639396 [Thrips palmi]|uniref:Uncharacterized protein LOC117639396 n=1 Tax=Thrips palmi TaxID=161013 RepID=A0A6P8Y3L1_THRPL|nr:uncharacterized protein LOC117639396 [Thrips palmi]